jgi:uncharacterized RDD family membrane protein YckC
VLINNKHGKLCNKEILLPNQLTLLLEHSKITRMNPITTQSQVPATIIKRLLAIFYDSFLLIAVLFLAMAVMLLVSGGYQFQAGNPLMTVYLLVVSYVFFGWFWTHGGQTLGMRAWKLQVQQYNGEAITWRQAAIRFVTAVPAWIVLFLGIALAADIPLHAHPWLAQLSRLPEWLILIVGIVWLVLDQWPNGWRDKGSRTRIIKLSKNH